MRSLTTFLFVSLVLAVGCPRRAKAEDRPATLTVLVGGDVMVGRYKRDKLRLHGGPDPFEEIGPLLEQADVTLLNLETPIADHHPRRIRLHGKKNRSQVIFRMPTNLAPLLARYGVDALSLANNHAEDADGEGVQTTVATLQQVGVEYAGAHPTEDPMPPRRFQRKGHWVSLMAVTTVRNRGEPRKNQEIPVAYRSFRAVSRDFPGLVKAQRKAYPNDLIVVSIHWGAEGSTKEVAGQRRVARRIIEAGADLVWGHHPHVLQGVEAHGDGMILYSTGNCVFDMRDPVARRSGLFEVTFVEKPEGGYRAQRLVVHPLMLRGRKVGPRLATNEEAAEVLKPLMGRAARRSGMTFERDGARLVWERCEE